METIFLPGVRTDSEGNMRKQWVWKQLCLFSLMRRVILEEKVKPMVKRKIQRVHWVFFIRFRHNHENRNLLNLQRRFFFFFKCRKNCCVQIPFIPWWIFPKCLLAFSLSLVVMLIYSVFFFIKQPLSWMFNFVHEEVSYLCIKYTGKKDK